MISIITGANRGIGNGIAHELLNRNENNIIVPFNRCDGNDITQESKIMNFFLNLDQKNIYPEVLINNAGICKTGSIIDLNYKSFKETFNVNVFGLYYFMKSYISFCKKHNIRGTIINISSTAGQGIRPGRAAYAASKAAVISLSQSVAQEISKYNIKILCLCPGAINTDMRHEIAPDDNFKNMLQIDGISKHICDYIEGKKTFCNGDIITIVR